jgi:hypothetical protein
MRVFLLFLIGSLCASVVSAQVRTESLYFSIEPSRQKSDGLYRVIESEPIVIPVSGEPFVSIAPTMDFGTRTPSHAHIQLRVSANGQTWTDWQDAGHDDHAELREGLVQGQLVFFPAEASLVQFRVVSGLADILPESVNLFMVNPGKTPEADTKAKAVEFEVNTSSNYALPVYVPRSVWGASLNLTNNRSGATPITVTHLWVHHSAGQTNSTDFAAVVRSYFSYHTGPSLNWSDIGYNWLVAPTGVTYQGREHAYNVVTDSGNPDVRGAHAPGVNGSTMGVCVIGDYTSILPSAAAITALRNILAWKANEKGMDVLGRRNIGSNNYNIISGHRDDVVSSTACPGNAFYPQLPSLRRRVHAYLNPPTVAWNRVAPEAAGQMRIGVTIHPKRSQTVYFIEYATNAEFTGSQTSPERTIPVDINEATYFNETLAGLQTGTTYFARVIAVNSDASTVGATQSFVAGVTTSVETKDDGRGTMDDFALDQNFPNPFNPTTVVGFRLSVFGDVRLSVYDLMGREIAVLVDGPKAAGEHSVVFDATGLASGVYMVELVAEGQRVTRLMTLLK